MEYLIITVFILGYLAIALEHKININKSATALIAGIGCWIIYISLSVLSPEMVNERILHHLGEISGILFFLLGAMTIVELIDAHDGFEIISNRIHTTSKQKLIWIIGLITFFLSAVIDNLTATIVMVSISRKLLSEKKDKWIFAGIIVIAANAGGAWSPMGDVTTTMLWIGKQITAFQIMSSLIVPSLVSFILPVYLSTLIFKLKKEPIQNKNTEKLKHSGESNFVFITGMLALLSVPVFKTLTHLPPFMGMLFALGIMWLLTEVIHRKKDEKLKSSLSVIHALKRIDTATILFFLGILLCITALQEIGALQKWADYLTLHIQSQSVIILIIGLLSAIVDNVPLVAAIQGMYPLSVFPTDHFFWEFLAYATGTGGSMLIIGSAAGIAAMGLEKISFSWYLRNISILALIGYLSGAGLYLLQNRVIH
ncbi:MAG: sodium:proton antiporter NhaD [Bacteroidales bacterium]